jgi:hypothetical protein
VAAAMSDPAVSFQISDRMDDWIARHGHWPDVGLDQQPETKWAGSLNVGKHFDEIPCEECGGHGGWLDPVLYRECPDCRGVGYHWKLTA